MNRQAEEAYLIWHEALRQVDGVDLKGFDPTQDPQAARLIEKIIQLAKKQVLQA